MTETAQQDKRRNRQMHISEHTLETVLFIAKASGRRFSDMVDSLLLRNGLVLDDLSPTWRERYHVARAAVGGLAIIPVSLEDANDFIRQRHRHHAPCQGHKFSLGVADESGLRGVAVIGRPVARHYDDGYTLEVTRLCTDGVPNAPSQLLGAIRRTAMAMGYRRLLTYTLADESGISLKAAGWKLIGKRGGGSWNRASRPRTDKHPVTDKLLWEAPLPVVRSA